MITDGLRVTEAVAVSNSAMQADLARACGHKTLSDFTQRDITTWKKEMADLSGVRFAGANR